jgi:hypothetical protein
MCKFIGHIYDDSDFILKIECDRFRDRIQCNGLMVRIIHILNLALPSKIQ